MEQIKNFVAENQKTLKEFYLKDIYNKNQEIDANKVYLLEDVFDNLVHVTLFFNLYQQENKELTQLKDYLASEYEKHFNEILS